MEKHRCERRRVLMSGRRNNRIRPTDLYLDAASRARCARRMRVLLRRGIPVLLETPRWSRALSFLDDLAVDLQLDAPTVPMSRIDLTRLRHRGPQECWAPLLSWVREGLALPDASEPAHAADRKGFVHLLARAVDAATERRAIVLDHADRVAPSLVEDLVTALRTNDRISLVVTSGIRFGLASLGDLSWTTLPDYAPCEATGLLVEHLGPMNPDDLQLAAQLLGGVPALLEAVAASPGMITAICENQTEVWRALGPIAEQLRGAVDIANSDEHLASRLEQVAAFGPLLRDPRDERLFQAGLLTRLPGERVCLRTPVFGELAVNA